MVGQKQQTKPHANCNIQKLAKEFILSKSKAQISTASDSMDPQMLGVCNCMQTAVSA